jgi:hypothetical protein
MSLKFGEDMRCTLLSIVSLATCSFFFPALGLAQEPATPQTSGDQTIQLCTVAGTVVSANTGEPLKKALVVVSPKGDDSAGGDPNARDLTATTDAAGHFSIGQIPAGSYDLEVSRANYLASRYGQDQLDKPGATLSLAPGQKMTDLLFRLHHTAIITGRVLDEDGDPVRGATVAAVVHTTVRGKPKTEMVSNNGTNDLGEYRIVDLAPGRYSIYMIAPRFDFTGEPRRQTGENLPTYYPGTSDSARASILDVKSGDEIPDVDFVVAPKAPARTFKIRGHIVNSIGRYPDATVGVMLFPRSDEDLSSRLNEGQRNVRPDAKTGDFELTDVIPGDYVVAAFWMAGAKHGATTQNVDVVGSDVDGLSLVLTQGIDIAGRVTFEGQSAASAKNIMVTVLPVEAETAFSFGGAQTEVRPDGSFFISEIVDGSYSLRVFSTCRECYVKSAKANGVDLLDAGVQVASGAGPSSVAIVYSSETAAVNGTVTRKDGLPAPGALVVLVPLRTSHQKPDEYKTSTTDQYGRFEIRGVPPGHYNAFAWEKIDESAYGDPDFLRPLENMAESVDISANDRKTVQLQMIPAPDSQN